MQIIDFIKISFKFDAISARFDVAISEKLSEGSNRRRGNDSKSVGDVGFMGIPVDFY